VLHQAVRDELKELESDMKTRIHEKDKQSSTDRRRLLEFSESESKMMSQISTLKVVCDERAQKLAEQAKQRSEATDAFEREREYFTQTENNLRITIQRLKEAIKGGVLKKMH